MGKFSWILAFLVVLAISLKVSEARKKSWPIVDVVGYGKVLGSIKSTAWSSRKYLKFRNIKYGQVEERFKPAIPYSPPQPDAAVEKNDSGEKKEKKERGVNFYHADETCCLSLKTIGLTETYDFEGEKEEKEENFKLEDCLYLTVSTRNKTGNQPVMVYLAGRDVVHGESDILEAIPKYLLEKDIVLVAVQYRAGPLGFLSTLSEEMPGNTGVFDVIEALRWIQKYISFLGGDPTRVTLFGQYHSAAIINLLTMVPTIENEKLFTNVIYQSGSALLDGIATDKPLDITKQIGTNLNCQSVDDVALLATCLKTAKLRDLFMAYGKYLEENEKFPFLTVGGPSGLLTDFPEKLLASGNFRGYPTIGGSVKHPGVCEAMQGMNTSIFRTAFKKDLDALKTDLAEIGSKNEDQVKYVDEKFPNKIFFNNLYKSVLPAMIDIKGFDVKYSTSSALQFNTEKGSPSYLYSFNYLGFFSRLDCSKEVLNDVSMADDNIYLFPFPDRVENLTWKDIKMAKFMVELWTSFAATGNPSAPGLHKWPVLMKGNMGPYLGIDFIYKMGFDYTEEYFITLKELIKDQNIYEKE